MKKSIDSRRAAVLLAAIGALAGCSLHRMTQGEPDFDTAALLPRQPVALNAAAPGLVPVDALASSQASGGGWVYRTLFAWMDPTTGKVKRAGKAANPSLVRLDIPSSCNRADSRENQPWIPGPARQHSAGFADAKACYYALKSVIDDDYREYSITLMHLVDYGHLGADLAVQALTTASSVAGGASAKTVLSAVGSGVNASRAAIDEDVFYNQSITVIFDQMESDRQRLAAVAITALDQENAANPYTASEIYNNLMAYYAAGTFTHAMQALTAATGAAKTNCQNAALSAQVGGAGGAVAAGSAACN